MLLRYDSLESFYRNHYIPHAFTHNLWPYFCSFEPDEWCVGRYELFFLDSHLLECQVIEDISKASIINQDLMRVVVPYSYADNKCAIVGVVEMSSIFL